MDGLSRQIASTLEKARVAKGLSTTELAEMADVPEGTIDAIEAGTVYDFPYECITIATLLRVDLTPILGSQPDGSQDEMRRTYHLLQNLVEVMRS